MVFPVAAWGSLSIPDGAAGATLRHRSAGEAVPEGSSRRRLAFHSRARGHRAGPTRRGSANLVVVGRDTRESDVLQCALVDGIRAAGGDVILAGVTPPPAIAFVTTELGASCGAVISTSTIPPNTTASSSSGGPGPSSPTSSRTRSSRSSDATSSLRRPGRVVPPAGAGRAYLDHLVEAAQARLDGMTVVVDCANSSASSDAPEALRRLGATVHAIHCAPDGTNINEDAGRSPGRRRVGGRSHGWPMRACRTTGTRIERSSPTRPARSSMATRCSPRARST